MNVEPRYGVYRATVTLTADPQQLGRVRIAAPDFKTELWAEVAIGREAHALKIGDRVVIAFEGGDPAIPIVIGALSGVASTGLIYKIVSAAQWREAEKAGAFHGAAIDLTDGYIHFSSAAQVEETAAKHFAGQPDLLLVTVDATKLGDALKWEVSRGGALFPHLYAPLALDAVTRVNPLPLRDGRHDFTGLIT